MTTCAEEKKSNSFLILCEIMTPKMSVICRNMDWIYKNDDIKYDIKTITLPLQTIRLHIIVIHIYACYIYSVIIIMCSF